MKDPGHHSNGHSNHKDDSNSSNTERADENIPYDRPPSRLRLLTPKQIFQVCYKRNSTSGSSTTSSTFISQNLLLVVAVAVVIVGVLESSNS